MARSLYICYFGVGEPLVETQVLPYLRELIKGGHEIDLLTFEPEFSVKWTREEVESVRARLAGEGIRWHALAYHKRPSAIATAYDILRGAFEVRRIVAARKIDILHARTHVPGLMAMLARKTLRLRPKLLFDIRGFVPEEYTDAGVWAENGLLYRAAKRVERRLMRESDGFVVLTEAARRALFPESGPVSTTPPAEAGTPPIQGGEFREGYGRPVEVIPCCVDLDRRFPKDVDGVRASARSRLGVNGRFVFAHVGALGGLYMTEAIADLLAAARERDPSVFAMFLTQSDQNLIEDLLDEHDFGPEDSFVGRVSPDEVPEYLCAVDVGLSFVKATYATISRSPTKIPEYLACGVPIMANRGVGDVDALVENKNVGVLVSTMDEAGFRTALDSFAKLRNEGDDLRSRCLAAARDFELSSVGGERYRRIYAQLSIE